MIDWQNGPDEKVDNSRAILLFNDQFVYSIKALFILDEHQRLFIKKALLDICKSY